MKTLRMAWRQLLRDVAAGDIRILFAALVLAVVAVTAVGFVTERAERALAMEANRLLGGDAVVRGDAPITGVIQQRSECRRTAPRGDPEPGQHDPRGRAASPRRPARAGRGFSVARRLPHHRPERWRRTRCQGHSRNGDIVDDPGRRRDPGCQGRRHDRHRRFEAASRCPGGAGTRRLTGLFQCRAQGLPQPRRPARDRTGAGRQPPGLSPDRGRRCRCGGAFHQPRAPCACPWAKAGNDPGCAPGDSFFAGSCRPLPRPRRAGVGRACGGGGGDGRAPPQRAASFRHRGDALPRRQPAHAGRHPCRRTGTAGPDRVHRRRGRSPSACNGRSAAGCRRK